MLAEVFNDNSEIETICSKLTMKTPERRHGAIQVSLLITFKIFHILLIVEFEQVNVCREKSISYL